MKNFKQFSNIEKLKELYIKNGFDIEDVNDLSEEGYFDNIEWFDNNTLTVYRAISLNYKNLDNFKKNINNGIGRYWSYDKNIQSIWGSNLDYDEDVKDDDNIINIRCKGHLKINDIDFDDLLYAFNDDFYNFCSEKEIRGKLSGDTIDVIKYEIINEK